MKLIFPVIYLVAAFLLTSCDESGGNTDPSGGELGTTTVVVDSGSGTGGTVPGTGGTVPGTGDTVPGTGVIVPGTGGLTCDSATAAVKSDYDSVRRCALDTDCNYINGFFAGGTVQIQPRDATTHSVTTKDCHTGPGELLFLVVANGNLVIGQANQIRADVLKQQYICSFPQPNTVPPATNQPATNRCQTYLLTAYQSPPTCSPSGFCIPGQQLR